MSTVVLALNAGSSTMKFAVHEAPPRRASRRVLRGAVDWQDAPPRVKVDDANGSRLADLRCTAEDHAAAAAQVLEWVTLRLGRLPDATAHRVVHGGDRFAGPVFIDAAVLERLEAFRTWAPLHQPQSLAAVQALAEAAPGLLQVACFDTAFHARMPETARRFALPRRYHQDGVRRYGFHGLSYAHAAERLRRLDPRLGNARVIAAHLGSGASLCAMESGASVDSSMGFSPLDGLVMATRCGALDPGVVLHLHSAYGLSTAQVEDLLYRRSGLLGVSGVSGDMRRLLASSEPPARDAVELFVYRLVREIGALAASLGGVDAVVFTGGIGEHAAPVREAVSARLAWLGLQLDPTANASGPAERPIHAAASRLAAWIIPADEERVMAEEAFGLLCSDRRAAADAADQPSN